MEFTKYLVIKPKKLMCVKEIKEITKAFHVQYIDPTLNQNNSDLYDDICAAYTIKCQEDIVWSQIQILKILGNACSSFFGIKEGKILLGSISLNNSERELLSQHSSSISKYVFYGKAVSEKEKTELDIARNAIVKLIANKW